MDAGTSIAEEFTSLMKIEIDTKLSLHEEMNRELNSMVLWLEASSMSGIVFFIVYCDYIMV